MLSTAINSTSELVSIALSAEREAAIRYAELAVMMHQYGNIESATLFERMSAEEKLHEQKLIHWAEQTGKKILPNTDHANWGQASEKIYDAEARDPAQCTPYKALAYAVHNEESAFHFYTYVAANSEDTEVCKLAEMLAHEELGHAALLRTQRRREWHKERDQKESESGISAANIRSTTDLLAVAIFFDRSLLALLEQTTATHPELKLIGRTTRETLSKNEKKLSLGYPPGPDISAELISLDSWRKKNSGSSDNTSISIRRLYSDCDRSFTFYDSVVESIQDEATMLLAQKLCSQSLERIVELQQLGCKPLWSTD